MNAATGGSIQPYIYVTSSLVNKLSFELLSSVLAHECGHIACKHYLYHSIAIQLMDGIDNSSLGRNMTIRKYLSPALVRAFLYWDRCSELSADRAAVLCDGTADHMIDALLWIHGYGKNVDREAFLKQAIDFNAFVKESKINGTLEQMMIQQESHPRLANRVYECYEWSRSERYKRILSGNGTRSVGSALRDTSDLDELNERLAKVNAELEQYTSSADNIDYAFSVFSGIISGAVDALFIGDTKITGDDICLSYAQVNNFIQKYARFRGLDGSQTKTAIRELEKEFKVAQDNVWKGKDIKVSTKNHHLADLAHHPTPAGFIASLMVQFLRVGTFINKEGELYLIPVKSEPGRESILWIPAIITGTLKWFAFMAECTEFAENSGEGFNTFKAFDHMVQLFRTEPILKEVVQCADQWFGHLVSDVGGSKNTAGEGMGIPGVIMSLFYEIGSLPFLRNTGLTAFLDDLYENHGVDFRYELAVYKTVGKQTIPVILNELCVRTGYFLLHLAKELSEGNEKINWSNVIPFGNRTVERMITIASMTFTIADTTDAAVHAALESGGNWILFSGRFIARFNYVGAGRAAVAVVREVSDARKEMQLLHEKRLLSEEKAEIFFDQLQEFKEKLEQKVSSYLTEDITCFMEGLDQIQKGLEAGDSDLVIKGNLKIQKQLGHETQFKDQEGFDAFMDSDTPLQF